MRAHRNRVHHQLHRLLFGKQANANVEVQLLDFFQIFPIEARHDAIAQRIARLHDLRDLMLEAARFELDIESALAAGDGEHFVERGNSRALERAALELRAGVQSLELVERQLRDFALAIGRALDGIVMNHHDRAVAAELNVELAHVRARFDGGLKRAHGVLGKSTARPAMGYVQHRPPPPRWNNLRLIMMRVYAFVARTRKPARRVLSTMVARLGLERNLRGCQSHRPEHMQRATASRQSYTKAVFRTHSHLADEAAGILVAGGAIGCAVAGMKLPRAREDKTVALEAYFDRISATELSRLRLMMERAGMLAEATRDSTGAGGRNGSEREIIAIDTDPTALENARVNARLNGVEKSIRFSSVPLASIHRHFDLIAANILSHTLIELAPHLKRLVAPGGRLILGGFLADEADEVLAHYRSPLRCLSRKTHRGWTTAVMARAPR